MSEKPQNADELKKQDETIKHMQALLAKLESRSSKLKSESAELGKNLLKEKDD